MEMNLLTIFFSNSKIYIYKVLCCVYVSEISSESYIISICIVRFNFVKLRVYTCLSIEKSKYRTCKVRS